MEKPLQYCKVISLQLKWINLYLKINKLKNKKKYMTKCCLWYFLSILKVKDRFVLANFDT